MGKRFDEMSPEHQQFIAEQKLFFVGTATADSRVNISPKGMDSLRVLTANRVIWLNVTGSGNETAAHLQTHGRMTLMFAAFEGAPMILRLYGTARAIHYGEPEWDEFYGRFPESPGARQIFDMRIDLVQSSCGMAVPFFEYLGEREQLKNWAINKGAEGVKSYWKEKNIISLDGAATGMAEKL